MIMASHSRFRFACCAFAVLLAAGAAHAGEASRVAERGGFLVGHAYRCGISAEHLDPAAQLVGQLVAALSIDSDEREVAVEKFLGEVLVSVLASEIGDPLPSCNAIRRELALLEQHQRLVFIPGERPLPNETSPKKPRPQTRLTKSGSARKPPSAQPEGLSVEQRSEIALKLAAREQRRRPPSI
jgi:hypothetical protein